MEFGKSSLFSKLKRKPSNATATPDDPNAVATGSKGGLGSKLRRATASSSGLLTSILDKKKRKLPHDQPQSCPESAVNEPKCARLSTSPSRDAAEAAAELDEELDEDTEALFRDVDDLAVAEGSPISAGLNRHEVVSMERTGRELILSLRPAEAGTGEATTKAVLKGSWMTTEVKRGDVVNVLADYDGEAGAFVLDDLNGLLVLHPDFLISGTSVVSTLFCMRKAVLNEKFKGLDGSSKTMFIGTLVHELLQDCLKNNVHNADDVRRQFQDILGRKAIMQDLLLLKMSITEVTQEVEPFLPHIHFFTEKYVKGKSVPVPSPAFSQSSGRAPPPPSTWAGKVDCIRDIEENIWSPRLGIKGKIDLTLDVTLHNRDKRGRTKKTLPLELKTGRASGSAEHRGQVIMYSMMMSERRDDPESGLLLYLRNSSVQEVPAGIHEMRGLVQLRNELAVHLKATATKPEAEVDAQPMEADAKEHKLPALPEPINLRRACGQCPHLLACSLHQKVSDAVPEGSHAMAELVPQTLEHLSDKHMEYFKEWSVMCALEAQESSSRSRTKNLWCQTPEQRERNNTAVSGLTLRRVDGQVENLHEFVRGRSLPPVFQNGETVLLSSDRELALSQGIVVDIGTNSISIILDRRLRETESRDKRFHVDRYEYQGSMSSSLVSLAKLMSNNDEAALLRRLIIDKEPATFAKGLTKDIVGPAKPIMKDLNRVQQKAIFKSLMTDQYILLRGMPGTGKTTLIVGLVRLLVATGKSVLLTSYTHSAVDNILLKLLAAENHYRDGSPNFIRLGRKSRVHPDVVPFAAESIAARTSDMTELDDVFARTPIVATTCLGLNHPAVVHRKFDFCILDEAGQSQLLAAVGPLLHARKFILVGDPAQLPPVVQSAEARKLGMDVSLFSHLETAENTVPLTIQYRMNGPIMAVANHLTYGGTLTCGSEEIENRSLPRSDDKENLVATDGWLKRVLSGSLTDAVLFLDTTEMKSHESTDEHGVTNRGEMKIVKKIVRDLQRHCDPQTSIGVIAPYRAQVDLLRQQMAGWSEVDVNTVDQFQGKDKDVIIYSCTRSKSEEKRSAGSGEEKVRKVQDIVGDERRLNVAVTRAKTKLIMVGDRATLENYEVFRKLFDFLRDTSGMERLDASLSTRL